MASHAGDPFAKHFRPLADRCPAGVLHRGGDRRMAAHAEVAQRPLRERVDLLLKLVKHWADGSVGMARNRPLLVNLLMAFPAGRGRRIAILRERLGMGVNARKVRC
jgi:hypothetical protein